MWFLVLVVACCLPVQLRSESALPVVPSEAEVAAMAAAILSVPVAASPGGEVRLVTVGEDRITRFSEAADQRGLPGWRGQAIMVEAGSVGLRQVAAAVGPDWLDCGVERCVLYAPLYVRAGATLVIAGETLRMSGTGGAYLASFGRMEITGSVVEGWDLRADAPAWTGPEGAEFRPFIAGIGGAHTDIRGSVLRHLGFQGPMTYGNSHGTFDRSNNVTDYPSVDMVGNTVTDLYFGFYSFDADGVNILQNDIRDSHVYGIDPHDDTRDMLIALNHVEGSKRSHGIIASRRITDTVIAWNVSVGNFGSGIFLDKASHGVQVVGNLSAGNGKDGIVLHETRDIRIADNIVRYNAHNGIRIRASGEVVIENNMIFGNRRAAIMAYDWSEASREPNDEERGQIEPVSQTLEGNLLLNSVAAACVWRGEVEVLGLGVFGGGC